MIDNPLRHRGSKRIGLQRPIVEQAMRNRVRGVLIRGSQVDAAWMRRQGVRAKRKDGFQFFFLIMVSLIVCRTYYFIIYDVILGADSEHY